jgi:hypothetical protein
VDAELIGDLGLAQPAPLARLAQAPTERLVVDRRVVRPDAGQLDLRGANRILLSLEKGLEFLRTVAIVLEHEEAA